jgi:hypothetical protein
MLKKRMKIYELKKIKGNIQTKVIIKSWKVHVDVHAKSPFKPYTLSDACCVVPHLS